MYFSCIYAVKNKNSVFSTLRPHFDGTGSITVGSFGTLQICTDDYVKVFAEFKTLFIADRR